MKKEIKVYELSNEFLKVEILNIGAIIKDIKVKNKNGDYKSVVLSYDNLEEYRNNPAYLGAIVGRTAGRIKDGILKIENKNYELEKNNGINNLHGGINSISYKIWDIEKFENKIECKIKSYHLENGYPGNIEIKIEYILNDNTLLIKYFATTDRPTYLNLTNHSYFNLSGDIQKTIYDDILKIDSDYLVKIDKNSIPTDLMSLKNNIFNFKKPKSLKDFFVVNDAQKEIANNGIDHPYILNSQNCVELKNNFTGISMKIETDNPAVVVYTGNYLDEIGFKKHSAICFETQEVPNLFVNKSLEISPTYIDEKNSYSKYTKFQFYC